GGVGEGIGGGVGVVIGGGVGVVIGGGVGEVHARLFVLSSSNRGRLLGFTYLMRQKKQKNETRRTNLALWDSRRLEVKQ
ncbi:hypothetical protein Tco_1239035, partial [Tanacetum coccineum]